MGGLLGQAGFVITTVDVEEIIVNYPSPMHLLRDLQGMGESSAVVARRGFLRRDTLAAAQSIYKSPSSICLIRMKSSH